MSDDVFLTNKCVLLIYPHGASGKFLSNCLSMHDDFIYQDIRSKLNPRDRFNELMIRLAAYKSSGRPWNDLGLGDIQLFGVPDYTSGSAYDLEEHKGLFRSTKPNHYIIKRLADNGKHFFAVCHSEHNYRFYRRMWPNSQQIYFHDCERWIRMRDPSDFFDSTKRDIDPSIIEGDHHRWDCSSFIDKDLFMDSYVGLIRGFGLEPKNLDHVSMLYDGYMAAYFGNDQ